MSPDEFSEWLEYHQAAFPGVADWMRKNTPKDATTEQRPAYHWRRALFDVDSLDAKRATDAMLSGYLEEPRGYSSHPKAIRRWCKTIGGGERREQNKPEYVDGERVYSCSLCEDRGTVPIMHPRTVGEAASGVEFGEIHWQTCVAACTCEKGEKWRHPLRESNGDTRHALTVYREDAMFSIEDGILTRAEKERFWEWMEGDQQRRVEHHPNYRPEFA